MFLHRPLEEKDIAVICDFPQSADELFYMFSKARYPLTPAQLSDAIESRSDSTVIEMDGQVVGFANLSRWEFRGRCSLGNVIIKPGNRSRGVGSYLIGCMMDIAFDKHEAHELTASCFNHNVPGLLFYPKLGFRPFSIEERVDKHGARVALINLRVEKPEFLSEQR
ncbi:GNAT family N-acetyltransferase [Pseudomonas sp. CCI3.2]|uniref:GNAT family N-acetyltransferase n=1 Tax=unclassified Pseudomonas TaxID=196821 RepID=UPI002AC9D68A|nr:MULTISPECIES: GNAT family N-acetyltransferase [unclassified Pseudomonas]MEB0076442.1 GNAT family N-acetyltransferase [Pseudomonas sp. MH10out]MEB0091209.1 GNAT family N-acetyltransferase [Pseudomonas sp. CCI4.2]MEB0100837.1 GNAT family N-acetyltransferase [Pseudomonas sp. CCI3.2]MEB0128778.1 GNAT family N-acetyltransferase [Pseudomonas sp. CCI2.4]MEB0156995.1 GNAT family N-acetyltransferase [Pseudomonas sp. AH2 (2023)]